MANTETEPGTADPRSATNKNFPAGSITIVTGTTSPAEPALNDTWLPTDVVVPLEFTLKARIPLVLPEQAGLVLIIAYAKAPAGSITSDEGTPFSTQVLFAVSAGVLSTAETF